VLFKISAKTLNILALLPPVGHYVVNKLFHWAECYIS